ncbi:hypothetical protein IAU59_006512 [Kwoniella sp. CBS 9459]
MSAPPHDSALSVASTSAVNWEEMKTPEGPPLSFGSEHIWSHPYNGDLPAPILFEGTEQNQTPIHGEQDFDSDVKATTASSIGPPPLMGLGLGIHMPAQLANIDQSSSYINSNALLGPASSLIVHADPPMTMEGISTLPVVVSPESEPDDSSFPMYLPLRRSRTSTLKRRRSSSTRARSLDQTLGRSIREGLHGEQLLVQGDPVRFQFEIDKLRGFETLKKEDTWVLEPYSPSHQQHPPTHRGEGEGHAVVLADENQNQPEEQEVDAHAYNSEILPIQEANKVTDTKTSMPQDQDIEKRQSTGRQAFQDLFASSLRNIPNQLNGQGRFQTLTRPSSTLHQHLNLTPLADSPHLINRQAPIATTSGSSRLLQPLRLPAAALIHNSLMSSARLASTQLDDCSDKEKRANSQSRQTNHGDHDTSRSIGSDLAQASASISSKTITVVRTLAQAKEAIETLQQQSRKLETERDWTWQALVWTNKVADALVEPCNYRNTTLLTGRLCGKFLFDPPLQPPPQYPTLCGVPPVSELYMIVSALAHTVGCKIPTSSNIAKDPLTEQMFYRVLQTLLGGFDATAPIQNHYFTPDCVHKFTPPDVLWMLVHLGDPVFVEPLTNAIRTALWACTDTQRGMALLLLFGRIAGGKMKLGVESPLWAKEQVDRWIKHGYRLMSFEDGLQRVNEEDVRGALGHLEEKRMLEEVRLLETGHEFVMAERKKSSKNPKGRDPTQPEDAEEDPGKNRIELAEGDDSVAARARRRGQKRVKASA